MLTHDLSRGEAPRGHSHTSQQRWGSTSMKEVCIPTSVVTNASVQFTAARGNLLLLSLSLLQKQPSSLILSSQGRPPPNAASPSSTSSRGMTVGTSSRISDGVRRRTVNGTTPWYSCSHLRALVMDRLHAQGSLAELPGLTPSSPSSFCSDVPFSIRSDPIYQSCNIVMISTITLEHLSRSRYNSRRFIFIYSAQWPCEVGIIVSDLQMKPKA